MAPYMSLPSEPSYEKQMKSSSADSTGTCNASSSSTGNADMEREENLGAIGLRTNARHSLPLPAVRSAAKQPYELRAHLWPRPLSQQLLQQLVVAFLDGLIDLLNRRASWARRLCRRWIERHGGCSSRRWGH